MLNGTNAHCGSTAGMAGLQKHRRQLTHVRPGKATAAALLFLLANSAVAAEIYCAKSQSGLSCFPTLVEAEATMRHESPNIHGNWIDVDPDLVERYNTHVGIRSTLEKAFFYRIPDGKPLFDDGLTFAWCNFLGGCVRGHASESEAYAAAVAAHPAFYTFTLASDEALAGSGTVPSFDPEPLSPTTWRDRLHVNERKKVWHDVARRASFSVYQQHEYRCPDYQFHTWPSPLARACQRAQNDIIFSRNATIKSCGKDCSVGNPVHPITGVKSLAENDLVWEGLDLGRHYSSSEDAPTEGAFGLSRDSCGIRLPDAGLLGSLAGWKSSSHKHWVSTRRGR